MRRFLGEGRAIGGFAGSAADGIALFDRLDAKLREQRSPLRRAAGRARCWLSGAPIAALRKLEAMLVEIADADAGTFILSRLQRRRIEPDDGLCATSAPADSYSWLAARAR